MQVTRNLSFLFFVLLVFSSCDLNKDKPVFPDDDTKAPEILFVKPSPVDSPAYGANPYSSTDSLNIELDISDDTDLDRYQIDVFYRGDLYYLKAASDSMVATTLGSVSGKEFTVTHTFFVEYDPYAGPYEVRAIVWDKAGHKTEKSTFINVTNNNDPVLPVASIVNPSANDTFSIGEFIPVTFTCSDNAGIYDVFVRVRNTFNKEIIPDGETRFYPFTGTFANHSFYIAPTTPGNYSVEVYVQDVNRNMTLVTVPVYISTY